ncbi:MAG: hypothetical protein GF344_12900 [Chitinivibrionales bacterium]|nr:hypothetical protein [Chitinivibrionales bacterium]
MVESQQSFISPSYGIWDSLATSIRFVGRVVELCLSRAFALEQVAWDRSVDVGIIGNVER